MSNMRDWKILVVEDEPDGQEVIAGMLKYFSVSTERAMTAEQALEFLSENTYTAAIIDIALPGMDGMELIKIIRNEDSYAEMPCIAVTAFHNSQVKHECLLAGFNVYFPKPIDDTNFLRALDRLLA